MFLHSQCSWQTSCSSLLPVHGTPKCPAARASRQLSPIMKHTKNSAYITLLIVRICPCKQKASWACQASSSPAQQAEFAVPQSLDEAVGQACEALRKQLQPQQRSKKKKGVVPVIRRLLSVDIPAADTSANGEVALAEQVAQQLLSLDDEVIVIFCSESAADAVPPEGSALSRAETCFLGDCYDIELEGTLLVVGAQPEQLQQLEQLVDGWRGKGCILLNPGWRAVEEDVPVEHQTFAASFNCVYCFFPIAVKGLLSSSDAAVFRWVRDASNLSAPWAVLRCDKDTWVQIGRQARRPRTDEIELVMYNASAAASPVTQGIKLFKGFADKMGSGGKKQKQQ